MKLALVLVLAVGCLAAYGSRFRRFQVVLSWIGHIVQPVLSWLRMALEFVSLVAVMVGLLVLGVWLLRLYGL